MKLVTNLLNITKQTVMIDLQNTISAIFNEVQVKTFYGLQENSSPAMPMNSIIENKHFDDLKIPINKDLKKFAGKVSEKKQAPSSLQEFLQYEKMSKASK